MCTTDLCCITHPPGKCTTELSCITHLPGKCTTELSCITHPPGKCTTELSVQLEETKKVESQCIRDEEGRLLRDKGRIRERWVRFFRSLLNSKSDMIDADIPKRLPQHPVASALGIEPTEEEIATAMKAMANAKAVGPGGLPAELLKLGLQQDRTILRELHRLTTLIWRQGKVPRQTVLW